MRSSATQAQRVRAARVSGTTFETPQSLHADPQQKLRPQRSLCYSAAVLVWKTSQSSTRATCGLRGGNSPNCTPVTRSDGHVPIAERPRSADAGWSGIRRHGSAGRSRPSHSPLRAGRDSNSAVMRNERDIVWTPIPPTGDDGRKVAFGDADWQSFCEP